MKIILMIFNYYRVGKNKYKPIKVIPTIANPNLAIKILDTFIQQNQQVVEFQ